MHPWVHRLLIEVILVPLLMSGSQWLREVPEEWKKTSVTPIFSSFNFKFLTGFSLLLAALTPEHKRIRFTTLSSLVYKHRFFTAFTYYVELVMLKTVFLLLLEGVSDPVISASQAVWCQAWNQRWRTQMASPASCLVGMTWQPWHGGSVAEAETAAESSSKVQLP